MTLTDLIHQPIVWALGAVLLISTMLHVYCSRTIKRYLDEKTVSKLKGEDAAKRFFQAYGMKTTIERMEGIYDVRYMPKMDTLVAPPAVCQNRSITAIAMMMKQAAKGRGFTEKTSLYKSKLVVYTILYWLTYGSLICVVVGGVFGRIDILVYGGAIPYLIFFLYNLIMFLFVETMEDRWVRKVAEDGILDVMGMRHMISALMGLSCGDLSSTFSSFTNTMRGLRILLVGRQQPEPMMTPEEREKYRAQQKEKQKSADDKKKK